MQYTIYISDFRRCDFNNTSYFLTFLCWFGVYEINVIKNIKIAKQYNSVFNNKQKTGDNDILRKPYRDLTLLYFGLSSLKITQQ